MFWKWINERTLAIVTATACYHWSMDGSSDVRSPPQITTPVIGGCLINAIHSLPGAFFWHSRTAVRLCDLICRLENKRYFAKTSARSRS